MNVNWLDEVIILDNFAKYHIDFTKLFSKLEDTLEGHLGRIKAAQHINKL